MFIVFVLGAGLAALWTAVAFRAMRRLQTSHPSRVTETVGGTSSGEVTHVTAWTVLFVIVAASQIVTTGA